MFKLSISVMIYTSLTFLREVLNNFISLKDPLNSAGLIKPVELINVVNQENKLTLTGDRIFFSLINTEEETVGKAQLPYLKTADDKLVVLNPDIKLNLYLQFAAFSDKEVGSETAYARSLKLLDQIIFFFQFRNVFRADQYPALLAGNIEKLIIEPISLTFEQLNHLWATLGAKYLPSVLYKCRMLTFREAAVSPEVPLIKELNVDENILP